MTNDTESQPRIWTCPEHEVEYGPGSNMEPIFRSNWSCPECTGEANRVEKRFRHLHLCYEHWLQNSGISRRYSAATPASIQPVTPSAKSLAAAVKAYTDDIRGRYDAGSGLVLLGPPGLGKTLALAAIINAACRVYNGPIYAVWPDVLAEVKAGFGGAKDDPRREAIERLRSAPFLALDEVAGVRDATNFDHGELFGLIDYRYREELPTLVAANCTPAQFPGMVGERVADRLLEMGPQLVLTGASQRGKIAITGPDALAPPENKLVVRVHAQGQWRERSFDPPDGGLRA